MKALYCKLTSLAALFITAGISLSAQTLREESTKEFNANSSTELSVINQFGNITVTDWDQNRVAITTIIEVTNSDEAKAKKVMDKIKIEFKEDGSRIFAKTIIGEQGKLNLNNDKGEKQSFRIDYFIKCPKNIKLSLDNQFGEITVGSLDGSFSADLQFGSFNGVSLSGLENKIDLQFGELTVGTIQDATIDIQHGKIKISDCGKLKLDAQFTEIELGNVASLDADVSNCEFNVDGLSESLKLQSNMGSAKIGMVGAGFKSISVEQNMGDFTMGIDPKAGFTLNAEVNMGSIKVPDGMKVSREKDKDVPGVTSDKVSGTFGNGNSTIKINGNMGSVKIK